MPIPQKRPPRFGVYGLVVLGFLCTAQLSFGYRWRGWLSPSDWTVDFGGRPVGAATRLPEVFTNNGHYSISVTSASLAGSGFTLSGPSFPLTLNPGESVTLDVIFDPTSDADYSGTLTMTWGRYGRTLNIVLSGTGTGAGSVSAVPGALSFGNVTVGSSLTRTGTLKAAGESATISSLTTTNGEFTVSGLTLPFTLAAGQSIPFTVKFSPKSAGAASANLSFVENGTGSVASQTLSGTGSAAPAATHSVSLSWDDSASDIAGYNIYRGATSGGPYTKVNSAPNIDNTYTDTSVGSGKTYFYVVTTVGGAGAESGHSSEVTALVPTP